MKSKGAPPVAKDIQASLDPTATEKNDEMLHEDKFALESLEDPIRVSEYLRTMADGIETGRILLTAEDRQMVLCPGSLMKVTVKGKRSGNKGKLSIKLAWTHPRGGDNTFLKLPS